MTNGEITFETLNAYVDGELDATDAAVVARAVAEDAMLARQVATLSRLRSAVADSIEAPDLVLPKRPPARAPGMAMAASIAFALFISGSALMTALDRPISRDWLAPALTLHQKWDTQGMTAQTRAAILLAGYAETVPGAYVPDLSAARLSVVHASVEAVGDDQGLVIGYRGTRGCKVSLMIFPSVFGLTEDLTAHTQSDRKAFAWQAGDNGYVIVSEGMEIQRFRLIAESVRRTSFERLPLNRETRMALRDSRDESAPCIS